jgi:hypothetical protein
LAFLSLLNRLWLYLSFLCEIDSILFFIFPIINT